MKPPIDAETLARIAPVTNAIAEQIEKQLVYYRSEGKNQPELPVAGALLNILAESLVILTQLEFLQKHRTSYNYSMLVKIADHRGANIIDQVQSLATGIDVLTVQLGWGWD
jgi:hypothetical protein